MATKKEAPHQESISANMTLMEEIGAPSYNPIPPDHTKWALEQPGVPPVIRLWAWVIDGTLDHKTGRQRSPFVVDEFGNERHIKDAAKRFGWDRSNLGKYWKEVQLRGWARPGTAEEGRKRIFICGKVNPVKELEEELAAMYSGSTGGRKKSKNGLRKPHLADYYKGAVLRHIERLPANRKEAITSRLLSVRDEDERLRVDMDEARRTYIEQKENSIFDEFGIPKTRIPLEKRKKLGTERKAEIAERDKRIKPLIKVVERYSEYAQTTFEFGDGEVYADQENGFTQTAASLLNTEKIQRENASPRSVADVPIEVSQSVSTNGQKPTDRLTGIAAVIPHTLIERLNEPLTVPLLQRISEALGDAPPENLRQRIDLRWKKITSLGLLVGLASDVQESWRQGEAERRKAEELKKAAEEKRRADLLAWTRASLDDPDTPEEDRMLLVEMLQSLQRE
jgi:hypothetical protein